MISSSFVVSECITSIRVVPSESPMFSLVTEGMNGMEIWTKECKKIGKINAGGEVFDHQFYPGPSPSPTVLISSRRRPVQLINTVTGSVLSAYPAYSCTDEIVHAFSLSWSPACQSILGGFSACIKVWDVQRPGKQIRDIPFEGIVGATKYTNEQTVVGGTYSGRVGLFDVREKGRGFFLTTEKSGGVFQLEIFNDLIVSGHRKDKYIRVWDIRSPESPLFILPREVKNYQKYQFAITESVLFTGDQNGMFTGFDLKKGGEICIQKTLSTSPLVVVAATKDWIVTGSGQRTFSKFPSNSSDSDEQNNDNRVSVLNV